MREDGALEYNYLGNDLNVGRNFIKTVSKKIYKAVESKGRLQTFEYIDQTGTLKIRNL